jgi:hypothetical protein
VGEVRDASPESGREGEGAPRSRSVEIGEACRNVEREVGELLARATIEWVGEPDVRHLPGRLLDVLKLLDEIE